MQKLIKKCIEGDRRAENELYTLFSAKMYAICYRYSKNKEEAKDILHEGFLKVFENLKNFKNEGALEGWIRRIMVNTAIYKYRQRSKLYPIISIDNIRVLHHSDEDIISRINAKELICMIQKLPPAYQMVFNLYVFEGYKHKEIAEELGISEGTSKSNFFEARAILQQAINVNYQNIKKAVSR
ncbi:MAG TPA: RNA polymerase sigma factor [Bacteroidia bacterium]|jgi:RNA polymerase sigma factor (sigma-70 family)|nr:RNA polymerase sigma factor [Bacteroidia bacterium]